MKEIGGYFGLEQLISNEYHSDVVRLNTATNALLYLLKAKGITKLFIPFYLCDSISRMLDKNGYEYEYYFINSEFQPIFNRFLCDDEYLYIVNYYGQFTDQDIQLLKNHYKQIIIDNTHAFFQKPLFGIDTIYSCRKFFGVPDGAYLATNRRLDDELMTDTSKDRMTHILGRCEGRASDYYNVSLECETAFYDEPLKYMSKITRTILGAIDYEKVRQQRSENYTFLDNHLKSINKLNLKSPEGAFTYPLFLENAQEIRKRLIDKKIYVPIYWTNVLETKFMETIDYQYAANILPIPCDQRYKLEDMNYIIECLNNSIMKTN